MRVFPTWGITAPRLPLEESYSFFIRPSFRPCRFPNRNDANIVVPRGPDHNHQGTERVRSQSHEPLLSLSRLICNRDCQGVAQDAIAFGKGDTVFFEICGVLLGIKGWGHKTSVCT